jgi:hypothetical protein
MFETLFGSEMPLAARFFIAFLVVLALIGLTAWLVRRFGANRLGGSSARGRQPRLAVIDAASVDGRRRLVLIRRDNIEHLLMIGGPTDLVVEPNIVRAVGAMTREPVVARMPAEVTPRAGAESSWPLQPASEPTPIPAPRPYRSAAIEEPWLPPEPGARARPADSLTGLAAELSSRLTPPETSVAPSRAEPRANSEPRASAELRTPVAAPPSEPPPSPQNDHNLAEMAQQLEAALRRAPDGRPPVTDPLGAAATPQAKPAAPMREFKSRGEPKFEPKLEPKFEPKFDAKPGPRLEAKPEPKPEPAAAPAGKHLYDNLEQEMANLLGRPSGKT